jgi:hypothetical protein
VTVKLKVIKQPRHTHSSLASLARNILKILILAGFPVLPVQLFADDNAGNSYQFTGVLLFNAALLYPQETDVGYSPDDNNKIYISDDESIRLIATGNLNTSSSWEIQYLNQRQATDLTVLPLASGASLFRIKNSRHYFVEDTEGEHRASWYHELDRLYTKFEYDNFSAVVGRQAISWGSGRFWQPTDVFGAFSPIEINREYKPGIDAVRLNIFPDFESSLALAYVFGNQDIDEVEDSAALHYRTIIGQDSEITLLAGKITGIVTGGGSFETSWSGIGWRLESVMFKIPDGDKNDIFSIAGIDYQFANDLILAIEYYYNSLGATKESRLPESTRQLTYINGQQKHLGRNVIGLALTKTLTPLLTGNYNFLASALETEDEKTGWSSLHQLLFSYSIADEADALLAFLYGNGKGLNMLDQPRSEFGHTPASISLRLRYYF